MRSRQMLTIAAALLVTGFLTGTSNAQFTSVIKHILTNDPYQGRPPSGDCRTLVDRYGIGAVWHGEFAGKQRDIYSNRRRFHSYFDSGCFLSERACRIWQGRSLSALRGGPSIATRCHRPVPNWELR